MSTNEKTEIRNGEVEYARLVCPKHSEVLVFQIQLEMSGLGTWVEARGTEAVRWMVRLFDVLGVDDFQMFVGAKCRVRKVDGGHIGAKLLAIGHWSKDTWLELEEKSCPSV